MYKGVLITKRAISFRQPLGIGPVTIAFKKCSNNFYENKYKVQYNINLYYIIIDQCSLRTKVFILA